MGSQMEIEIELKSCSEKVWNDLKHFTTSLPKALPNTYDKIEVIEGDGTSVGSIIASTFKPSESTPMASTVKERIDVMDDEKKIMKYSYIEGKILQNYKSFSTTFSVSSNKSDDGTIIKCLVEFEKANADVPNPHFFTDFVAKVFHDWDAYLLNEASLIQD